jgi:peptide/nickel transport system substrate-binding protein
MRRLLVASVLALSAVLPSFASAQTLKVVMHSDLKALDPIWSGAYITRNYGYLVYDVLFAVDENFRVKPQMVESHSTSDDGLTWTFKLRDGLEWPRTASRRSSAGRHGIPWVRSSPSRSSSTRRSIP